MIWRIAIFLGGLTFIQTGYSVLTDPTCQRVSLSGFRFFTTTCTTQGHGLPTVLVGVFSILIGFGISFATAGYIYETWVIARFTRNLAIVEEGGDSLESRIASKRARIQSIGCGTVVILMIILYSETFIIREVRLSHFKSVLNDVSVCNQALMAETDFNKTFSASGSANDVQTQIDELNKIAAQYKSYSGQTNSALKSILLSESDAYALIATSATNNDSVGIKNAEAKLNQESNLFVAACLPK